MRKRMSKGMRRGEGKEERGKGEKGRETKGRR